MTRERTNKRTNEGSKERRKWRLVDGVIISFHRSQQKAEAKIY